MNKFKGGMYSGEQKTSTNVPVSLNKRFVKVLISENQHAEVPNAEYISTLEKQILDLRQKIDILMEKNTRHDRLIQRIVAAVRKVEARFK